MESVLVAYSGGVDSTFLLKVASDLLGNKVLAVTAISPTYSGEERNEARQTCRELRVRQICITTNELDNSNFTGNPPERCYHCKKELFGKLREIATEEGIPVVTDAGNVDDCSDYRPGRKAAQEIGVRSPLIEAGMTKNDIRALSREMGLASWSKPAMACLASRFPYGESITLEKLSRVEKAERLLRRLGFRQVRVRSHGKLARIEVDSARVPDLTAPETADNVVRELKRFGFLYVTVDLQGYRTGSLNEAIEMDS